MVVGSASGWMASVPGLAPGGRCLKDRLRRRFHMFARVVMRGDCNRSFRMTWFASCSRTDNRPWSVYRSGGNCAVESRCHVESHRGAEFAKRLHFSRVVRVWASVVELGYEHRDV